MERVEAAQEHAVQAKTHHQRHVALCSEDSRVHDSDASQQCCSDAVAGRFVGVKHMAGQQHGAHVAHALGDEDRTDVGGVSANSIAELVDAGADAADERAADAIPDAVHCRPKPTSSEPEVVFEESTRHLHAARECCVSQQHARSEVEAM